MYSKNFSRLSLEEVVFYTPVVEGINTMTELIEMFIEHY